MVARRRVVTRALIVGGRVRITDAAAGTSRALFIQDETPGRVTVRVKQVNERFYRGSVRVDAEWRALWPDLDMRLDDRNGRRVAFRVADNLAIDRVKISSPAVAGQGGGDGDAPPRSPAEPWPAPPDHDDRARPGCVRRRR